MRAFMERFVFDPAKSLFVGVEQEYFLTDYRGVIAPIALTVLKHLSNRGQFGYELSACQLESRVGPFHVNSIEAELMRCNELIESAEDTLGFGRSYREVGPFDMPLDIYPDPTGRYTRITKNMPSDILRAACRVIGTHIHVGMPDHATALRVYNSVLAHYDELCAMGDLSNGERLKIYKIMAPDYQPGPYASWDDFIHKAREKGWDKDPRQCWTLIRISIHGTIEFRMFGVTDDLSQVVKWVLRCHELCKNTIRLL